MLERNQVGEVVIHMRSIDPDVYAANPRTGCYVLEPRIPLTSRWTSNFPISSLHRRHVAPWLIECAAKAQTVAVLQTLCVRRKIRLVCRLRQVDRN